MFSYLYHLNLGQIVMHTQFLGIVCHQMYRPRFYPHINAKLYIGYVAYKLYIMNYIVRLKIRINMRLVHRNTALKLRRTVGNILLSFKICHCANVIQTKFISVPFYNVM